jgi:hypothetical protein
MDAGGLRLLAGLRDDVAGARCTMVDGSAAAARLLRRIRGPRFLPEADCDIDAARTGG